ncbi:DUF6504 family protein [Sphingomonas sp. M1-B02]|uniref:DUF6504 family protein n=1 Tax=Sphingomonas sp. M1-B02 TaxID=3114300 RepID=UPI0022402960|nr:DUF6504 family protein [Sphingomonas sp. S6-11]UZK65485.1 DNA polymerase Y family protein [Sphingomonas sp. S6-11]
MHRVAALYLPMWPLDRLRRADARTPPEAAPLSLEPLQAAAAAEQENACSAPRGGGWRPGARWARGDAPAHVRPARHEVGRREEAVGHPFRAMPPDEGGAPAFLPELVSGRGTTRSVVEGPPTPVGGLRPPPLQYALRERSPSPSKLGEELLVTSIRTGNQVLIAAASPGAQALGIRPGMALTQARAQVPGLDIRPADPESDRADLHRLAVALAQRWSPSVAIADDATLFLDLSGVAHLHGGEAPMARRLVRLLARMGVTARVAIADTAGAAWALAHFRPDGECVCPTGEHAQALSPLPIEALRIDPAAIELLHRLGVERIAQLLAMPRAPLVRRFGGGLVARLEQALGGLPEPLDPVIPPEPIAIVQRFAEPIATPEAIEYWLGQLVPRLATALEQKGLGALRIELIADRIDGVPQRIRIGLARPNRDPAHLLRLFTRRIEQVEPGYGVDAIALHVRRSGLLGAEPFVERLDEATAPDLAPLVDTLATRIGIQAMWRSRPVESDVPERSVARMPVLDPPERAAPARKQDDVRQLDRSAPVGVWHPDWPRPARLLHRPEPIDHVMAELPDHAPLRFSWRGRLHRVVRSEGPERILGEWWRHNAERHSVRDYYRVEDEQGRRFWLFRRGDSERAETGDLSWFLHGCFG